MRVDRLEPVRGIVLTYNQHETAAQLSAKADTSSHDRLLLSRLIAIKEFDSANKNYSV